MQITFADGSVRDFAADSRPDRRLRYLLTLASEACSSARFQARAFDHVATRAVVSEVAADGAFADALGRLAVLPDFAELERKLVELRTKIEPADG